MGGCSPQRTPLVVQPLSIWTIIVWRSVYQKHNCFLWVCVFCHWTAALREKWSFISTRLLKVETVWFNSSTHTRNLRIVPLTLSPEILRRKPCPRYPLVPHCGGQGSALCDFRNQVSALQCLYCVMKVVSDPALIGDSESSRSTLHPLEFCNVLAGTPCIPNVVAISLPVFKV